MTPEVEAFTKVFERKMKERDRLQRDVQKVG
jgi:hypothetical protein